MVRIFVFFFVNFEPNFPQIFFHGYFSSNCIDPKTCCVARATHSWSNLTRFNPNCCYFILRIFDSVLVDFTACSVCLGPSSIPTMGIHSPASTSGLPRIRSRVYLPHSNSHNRRRRTPSYSSRKTLDNFESSLRARLDVFGLFIAETSSIISPETDNVGRFFSRAICWMARSSFCLYSHLRTRQSQGPCHHSKCYRILDRYSASYGRMHSGDFPRRMFLGIRQQC